MQKYLSSTFYSPEIIAAQINNGDCREYKFERFLLSHLNGIYMCLIRSW